MEHPSVLEVAVTGVPDEKRGFVVKATIVLKEGFKPSDDLIVEIQNFVKNNTAPYKYPRIVEFVDELPKTLGGKIAKVEDYTIPTSDVVHRLVIIEKIAPTPTRYPRAFAKIKKAPL